MSFPLSIFYIAYLVLVGIFFLFSFFNLYHLLRFGSPLAVTLMVATLYLLGAAVLLVTSWGFLRVIDWSAQFQLLPSPEGFGGFK